MPSALQLIGAMQSDEIFVGRVNVACELLDVECTAPLLRQTAIAVVGSVTTDGFGNADTTTVTDAVLLSTLGEITGKPTEAASLTALLPSDIPLTTPSFGVAGDGDTTVQALQNQLEAFASENQLLAAKVAAYEGNDALAATLLTGEPLPDDLPHATETDN